MRSKERIPIILNHINWTDFIHYLGLDMINACQKCELYKSIIYDYWIYNPNLRLTQVLVNLGIIYNEPGNWYYVEEIDYFLDKKIVDSGDILFWGTRGKDGKQPLKFIALNQLESSHIEAILKTQYQINKIYKKILINILRKRKLKAINS